MYSRQRGLVLGFHGCDLKVRNLIVSGEQEIKASHNDFDWLGHGIYFWENSIARAEEYANYLKKHPNRSHNPIKKPSVVGSILDLGFCLDLTDFRSLTLLKIAYKIVIETYKKSGFVIPENTSGGSNSDLLRRELDCAVIETLHLTRQKNNLEPYDSIKAVFWEGRELYPKAGFKEKNHIQLCIRNRNCIKGLFIPRQEDSTFHKV
jgi:hypothetical protein